MRSYMCKPLCVPLCTCVSMFTMLFELPYAKREACTISDMCISIGPIPPFFSDIYRNQPNMLYKYQVLTLLLIYGIMICDTAGMILYALQNINIV